MKESYFELVKAGHNKEKLLTTFCEVPGSCDGIPIVSYALSQFFEPAFKQSDQVVAKWQNKLNPRFESLTEAILKSAIAGLSQTRACCNYQNVL